MTALSGTAVAAIESLTYTQSKAFSDTVSSLTIASRQKFTNGTGVNQADQIYEAVPTIAGSGALAIDLVGVTNDPLNLNIAMLTICEILIINKDLNGVNGGATLTIGGGSNPITGLFGASAQQIKLPPGGTLHMWCYEVGGLAVAVAGTGDILNITNGAAGSSTFQIVIIGRSV